MATTIKTRRRKLLKKLKSRFRLTVLNENTFEEQFSYSLTPMNVIIMFGGLLLVFGALIYALVAFTPLKAYVIPDFTDYAYREDAHKARMAVDSLQAIVSQNDRYIRDLQVILSGGTLRNQADTGAKQAAQADLGYDVSEVDSALRQKLSAQDRYQLELDDESRANRLGYLLFKPVNGTISNAFNAKDGHFGVDLVAPMNEPVKATLDGTVILSSFTADGGNVLQIQHANNMVSVYKHNSVLLKKEGDQVKAGESIAFVGNSGDHSDGPHLHFELWMNGIPVNPTDYLVFEK